jgi:osmotically-inducible protein OsmY
MTRDWEERDRAGRGYGGREDYSRRDRARDWSDRAGDEVRSWFGDDDADRRRRMEDDRDYGMGGSQRDRGRYSNERGSYGSRSGGGSGHDPYGSGRGDYGPRRGEGSGRGDFSDAIGAGMAGRGMGIANYASGSGGDYGGSSYGRDYGGQGYGQGRSRAGSEDRGFFERAGDEVASWFGDEDAQRRRENDGGHRGRGPRNYSRSDERIREDVSDRLSDDRHIDASDIEVSVSGGEVTLDGTVENRLAKRHAEDLAESCSGVKHVQNNLRVKDRQTSTGISGTMSGGMSGGSTGLGGAGSGSGDMSSSTTPGSGTTGTGTSKTQL